MKSFLMMQFEIRSYQILIFDSIHLFSSFLFNLENSLLTVEKMASEQRDEVKVKQADLDGE